MNFRDYFLTNFAEIQKDSRIHANSYFRPKNIVMNQIKVLSKISLHVNLFVQALDICHQPLKSTAFKFFCDI